MDNFQDLRVALFENFSTTDNDSIELRDELIKATVNVQLTTLLGQADAVERARLQDYFTELRALERYKQGIKKRKHVLNSNIHSTSKGTRKKARCWIRSERKWSSRKLLRLRMEYCEDIKKADGALQREMNNAIKQANRFGLRSGRLSLDINAKRLYNAMKPWRDWARAIEERYNDGPWPCFLEFSINTPQIDLDLQLGALADMDWKRPYPALYSGRLGTRKRPRGSETVGKVYYHEVTQQRKRQKLEAQDEATEDALLDKDTSRNLMLEPPIRSKVDDCPEAAEDALVDEGTPENPMPELSIRSKADHFPDSQR